MFAALIGCKGAKLCIDRRFNEASEYAIDRNAIWFPETKIESFDGIPAQYLRPLCDILWNAVGFEKSFGFDENGNWKGMR
jgi:hypothetical protein